MEPITRRNFVTAAAGAGLAATHPLASAAAPAGASAPESRLPREVWIATISQDAIRADSNEQMTERILARAEEVAPFRPDFVVFPEMFPAAHAAGRNTYKQRAESLDGPALTRCREFARKHACHLIAPIGFREAGKTYNAAFLFDRSGAEIGRYYKHHLTIGEVEAGLTPGRGAVPVFETDRGRVGMQICFDIEWNDGWQSLERQGAEIVFWPSAFAGGRMINAKAWQHNYVVVSSTWKNTSKICDIDGEPVAWTGNFNRHWAVGAVNLEKIVVHTYPASRDFQKIFARYGRDVVIRTHHEEEWSVIESRSPRVRIADVAKEFGLLAHQAFMNRSEKRQRDAGWAPEREA